MKIKQARENPHTDTPATPQRKKERKKERKNSREEVNKKQQNSWFIKITSEVNNKIIKY